ncbi:MAG: CHAT domain-containing protein [Gaiellaceae bacterium]
MGNGATIQDDLLPEATVRIDRAGRHAGSGFFVAPGTVVTCDHVVRLSSTAAAPQLTITDSTGATHPVEEVSVLSPTGEDDLASLRVAVSDHLCVLLDAAFRVGDKLHSFGYPQGHTWGVPTGLTSEGEEPGPHPRVKVREGQVQPGMSGSPVLNLRTGGVFGILKKTRGERTDLGGYAIPVTTLFKLDSQLRLENERFHEKNRRWFDLLPSEQQRLVKAAWGPVRAGEDEATLFVVTVGQVGDGWQVSAAVHPPGDQVGPIAVDFNRVRQEVARLFRDWASRGRVDVAEQIRLLGDILYRALLPDEVDERLEALLASEHVHVALHFEESANSNLVHLPWEHLYVPKRGPRSEVYLATNPQLRLSRVLEAAPEGDEARPPAGRLSVLLVGAKPNSPDNAPDDVRQTAALVEGAVNDIQAVIGAVEAAEVTVLDAPTAGAIASEIAAQDYDVVHYLGPGEFDSGVDKLALGANTSEGIDYFSIGDLASSLEEAPPKLVVLQLTGRRPRQQGSDRDAVLPDFAILARELLSERIPAVVGFQYPVESERARMFSEKLYPALAAGRGVDSAVQEARRAMRLGQVSRAFISPALFLLRPGSIRLTAPAGGGEPQGSEPASALAHA